MSSPDATLSASCPTRSRKLRPKVGRMHPKRGSRVSVTADEELWMRSSVFAAAATGSVLLALSGAAEAQQKFDGRWSVLLETQRGECDKAYRYPVAIENGIV